MDHTGQNQTLPQSSIRGPNMPPNQNQLSIANLPSGTWDVNFCGSCPRCHQWHNRMLLRLSRLPGVWSGVRCQRCSFKWFNLSGDSPHITLTSHHMVKLGPANVLSQRTVSEDRGERLGMDSILDQWHSISAMDGPVLASTGPLRALQDHTIDLAPGRQSVIPGALEIGPPARKASSNALDLDGATENTSRQTSRGQVVTLRSRKDSDIHSESKRFPRQPRDPKGPKQSKGASKMKTKIRKAITLLRGQGNLRREHTTQKPTSETFAISSQDQTATAILRDGPKVERAKIRKPAPAAVSRSATIQHTRCKSAPEEPQHRFEDEAFQPLFPRSIPISPACQNIFPQDFSELRRPRSLVARPLLCACDPDCHCKRPSSSLVAERALTDRASIYGLDLAQAEVHTRPSRRSHELAFIGTGFGGDSTTSIQSSILPPQECGGPSSSSRRQRPTSLHFGSGSGALAYESQATTAYAQSEGATASDISVPTPRTSCFQQQQRDLFLLAPPANNSPRPRMPSPSSAARTSPSIRIPHQHHHQPSDRTSDSAPLGHHRGFFDHPAADSIGGRAASVSPIQEVFDASHSGPVSSLSTEDDEDEDEDVYHDVPSPVEPRVSHDNENDGQGRQSHGRGRFDEYWRQRRQESPSLEQQRGSRSPGPLSVQPVT